MAQVLLQETVWREAEVGAHIRNRRRLLAAMHPEPAAVVGAVFCWETVLKVRRRCPLLQGGMFLLHHRWLLQGKFRCAGTAPAISQFSRSIAFAARVTCRGALCDRLGSAPCPEEMASVQL